MNHECFFGIHELIITWKICYESIFFINRSPTILLGIFLRGDFLMNHDSSCEFLDLLLDFLLKQDIFFVFLWFFFVFYLKNRFTIWIMSFGIQVILSFMTWCLCIYGLYALKWLKYFTLLYSSLLFSCLQC